MKIIAVIENGKLLHKKFPMKNTLESRHPATQMGWNGFVGSVDFRNLL